MTMIGNNFAILEAGRVHVAGFCDLAGIGHVARDGDSAASEPLREQTQRFGSYQSGRRSISDAAPHYRDSPVIREQLDGVAEAAHRIFADAFEIEIALDEVGEGAGQ